MQIELLTIGDELLLGFTVDTNAAYLARTLAAIGVEIVHRSTVGDDADAIAAAV
ncbi:MAG: competence/damage-inducible protein A, partial [Gemmatimonadaceae bacterium]|nr:competence/damage-inducible protein A [Gemmatimonadaceae bacterium]